MNSILRRILLINSFQNPRLRSILAASDWDSSKHPKVGTAVFPGQDNEILLKLMQLAPYITYDNVLSALKHKSRLNHEKSKNELCEFFTHIYNDLENNQQNNDIIDNNDNYSADDIDALDLALNRLRNSVNKKYNEQLQELYAKLKEEETKLSNWLKKIKEIKTELANINKQIYNDKDNIKDKDNIENNDFNIDLESVDIQIKKLKEIKNKNNDDEEDINLNEIDDSIDSLKEQLEQAKVNGDLAKVKELAQKIQHINSINALYVQRSELTEKLITFNGYRNSIEKTVKKIKSEIKDKQTAGSPFDQQILYTFERDQSNDNTGMKDQLEEKIRSRKAKITVCQDIITTQDNLIALFNNQQKTGKITGEEFDEKRRSALQKQKKAEELKEKLETEIEKILRVRNEKKGRDTRTLLIKLIDNGLYEEYCPYAYACEFIQNKCGKINNLSNDIKINESKLYQYNKSQEFQKALSILANSMSSIYREIIDDIYDKYSKYPAFNKEFDPTDNLYNNMQVVTYIPTEAGQGNYIYDSENKVYVYSEKGNFTREIKPLNAHTQISMAVPMDKYSYDESTRKYRLDPEDEYIQVPSNIRYSYDENTNQYKLNSNGNFIKMPSGEFQKISNGDFHKISKDIYKKQTVLENNNNFQKQIDIKEINYTFKNVPPGQGNYIYNNTTKKYEFSPNGNYIRVKTDEQDKEKYIMDGRIVSLTRQLVQSQYRNRNGRIDPVLVTYFRGKYDESKNKSDNIQLFFYELKKYIQWLQIIDNADPKKDIIDDNWNEDNWQRSFNKLKNMSNGKLSNISKYIDEELDIGTNNDTSKLTYKQLKDKDNTDKDRVESHAKSSNSLTNLKTLHKYNYDIYKNFHHRIDPIIVAWVENYHIYNAQRNNWYKQLKNAQQPLIKAKNEFVQQIQNLKNNISTEINNLPDPNTIPEMNKKRLIKKMLGIDMASIQLQTIDTDYRSAQIQQLRNKYEQEFKKLFEQFDAKKQELYQNNFVDRIIVLNKIVNDFIDRVNSFGDILNEVVDNDNTGIAKRLIELPTRWNDYLEKMARSLQSYIAHKEFRNFNVAYLVDLLENAVNKYGGAKKEYNPVNTDDFKDIPELNLAWARENITYELNKIFESIV